MTGKFKNTSNLIECYVLIFKQSYSSLMKKHNDCKRQDLNFDHRRFVLEFVERCIDFLVLLLLSGNMVSKVEKRLAVQSVVYECLVEQLNMQMQQAATLRMVMQTIISNFGFLINEIMWILFASRVSLHSQKLPSQLCCRFNRCNLPKKT